MAFSSASSTITSSNQQSHASFINTNNNNYTSLQPSARITNSQQWKAPDVGNMPPNLHWSPPPPLTIQHSQPGKKVLQLSSPTNYTPTPTVPLQKRRKNRVDLEDTAIHSPSSPSKSFVNSFAGVEECEGCICERPAAMIICRRCGSELYGHVQRVCQVHPKRINLMDHKECSFCRSIHLSEIHAPVTNGKT
uniref:Uncharacterized protein n=1 Tax=Ditylenchus dipsaci TaxID=166011 RepID=A0A915CN88_9BILA